MGRQVENFEKTLVEISRKSRSESVKEYMAKSLVVVSLGNNDYINNYLKPSLFLTSSIYDPTSFADLLLSNFTTHLLVSLIYSIHLLPFYHFLELSIICVCEVIRCLYSNAYFKKLGFEFYTFLFRNCTERGLGNL